MGAGTSLGTSSGGVSLGWLGRACPPHWTFGCRLSQGVSLQLGRANCLVTAGSVARQGRAVAQAGTKSSANTAPVSRGQHHHHSAREPFLVALEGSGHPWLHHLWAGPEPTQPKPWLRTLDGVNSLDRPGSWCMEGAGSHLAPHTYHPVWNS